MSQHPITTTQIEEIPAVNAESERQTSSEALTPLSHSTHIEGELQLSSESGVISNIRISGDVIETRQKKNNKGKKKLPEWKDHQVLRGAIPHELYLMSHEYAVVQGFKRNVLSCYRNKKEKKPELSSVAEKEQEYQALTPDVAPEDLKITKEIVYTLCGTPEERGYWTNKAIEKNKISRSKVLAKWPALESVQPEPVPTEEEIIYAFAQFLEPVLRKLNAGTDELKLRYAQEISEKDRQIRELTFQRDHLMDVIEKGPDPMNYFGTNKLLVQTIKELVDKQNLKH